MYPETLDGCLNATRINFGKALIDDESMKVVAYIVACNVKLTDLGIDHKGIGDAGMATLADALAVTKAPLKRLYLYQNEISDAGATALAGALRVTAAPVEMIFLHDNSIGDSGAAALSDEGNFNRKSITYLSLDRNQLSESAQSAMRKFGEARSVEVH